MTPFEQRQFAELVAEIVLQRLRDSPADGLLDGHQAAQLMNCSRPTIERWTRDGKIPSHKIGRLRRYKASELLELGIVSKPDEQR
jgi:excisionase family DNA binding protein